MIESFNFKTHENFMSKIKYDFELSKYTWFQTGGKALCYCLINNSIDLQYILKQIPKEKPLFILGAGSNLLVRDGGFNGIVIKLGKDFRKISNEKNKIIVGASVLDSVLSKFALNNSIKNLEFFSGIPGTVGGAIKMNAGCFGYETKDCIEKFSVINRLGIKKIYSKKDANFNYRTSSVTDDLIIESAVFVSKKGDKDQINSKMIDIINQRERSQPLKTKTGGSTFKNPKNLFAAKLIEESNCKGLSYGDAIVSEKHSNFIINTGNASANDIESLGEKVRERVYRKFNILLDWEIKIIGTN
ncbi:MAG: UDP-N-acetylenolpyruvoylglucosamine reductase [Alphaproteobacteria bacterium MarineAlpha5_Bin12]|nr:UDP-N-acetylenolpyruvoylglucosamine reductase [Pelagibacteraceae bacterium]PPR42022.1 MAG: UDP-N-acetylenolpyruvoylglucosamine reductase [Alphaproteobacteria bacterium MarineAlpha5_Bin12]|tara:strand:+ start:17375 stop:18277 length:903 start_codon:yes stop_codon:yes gene_type:complete